MVFIYFTVLTTQRLDLSRGLSTLGGFLYLHRISDLPVAKIPLSNTGKFYDLCGKSTLENVIIVTNMWDDVSWDVGEARESELITNFFKPTLDEDAQLVRYHIREQSKARNIIQRITQNTPIILGDRGEFLGQAVNRELDELIRRHQYELEAVREEMIQAFRDRDEQVQREIEEMAARHDEEKRRMRTEMERMVALHDEARRAMETEVRRMQERASFCPWCR